MDDNIFGDTNDNEIINLFSSGNDKDNINLQYEVMIFLQMIQENNQKIKLNLQR